MGNIYTPANLRTLAQQGLGAALAAPRKRRNEESEIQRSLISWWRKACKDFGVPEILLFSIPNGAAYGGTSEQRAKRGRFMAMEGQRKGVPDLFLACERRRAYKVIMPICEHTNFNGLFLELKTPTGVISIEQQIYHGALRASGYMVCVCRSIDECKSVITKYLKE